MLVSFLVFNKYSDCYLKHTDKYLLLRPNFQVDGAMQVFNRCRRKGHKFDISIFNMILHGFAAKKKVLDFQVFYHNMNADNVKANMQTYAALFEMYGQMKDTKMLNDICEKMAGQVGFSFFKRFGYLLYSLRS